MDITALGPVSRLILPEWLDATVARGLLGVGVAHRTAMAVALAATLPTTDAGAAAVTGADPAALPSPAAATSAMAPAALSGEALARTLGLSRSAVHKHVEHLRSLGFAVVPVAGAGYRLTRPFTDLVAAEAVLPFLMDAVPPGSQWVAGLPYRYLQCCESTNLSLKGEAASAPPGSLAVTDEQTGGRGRLGRTWVSEPGKDLTFSVLLRPSLAPAQAHLLSLAAALAVAEVLESVPGLREKVLVKWPNDVLLGGEKVCGILLEGSMHPDRLQWAVAGIGLNVNSTPGALVRRLAPEQAAAWAGRPRPVSLREHLGRDVPRGPLLARLLARLTYRWSEAGTASDLLAELRRRDALAGRRVEVMSGPPRHGPVVSGEARGIGPEGQLLVLGDSGDIVAVFAGDVTVRGPAVS